MDLVAWFRGLLGRLRRRAPRDSGSETFVYVVIRDPIGPVDRGTKYEDLLATLLEREGLGEITGGGSQLGDARPDGTRSIELCGIDVEVASPAVRESVLRLLRDELVRLGAPVGSELHYTASGVRLSDRLGEDGWVEAEPRSETHPLFGW
jgi:hypothetical protein